MVQIRDTSVVVGSLLPTLSIIIHTEGAFYVAYPHSSVTSNSTYIDAAMSIGFYFHNDMYGYIGMSYA